MNHTYHPTAAPHDGITREQIVAELENAALIAALEQPRRPEPSTGTDGEETCRNCAPNAERSRTYTAEMEMIRRGPVPTAEALGIDHLVSVAYNARARGETVVPLYVPADAKSAGVGTNTMTRALNQVRRWQDDPATASALSFRIEDEFRSGKHHVRLLALPAEDEDGTVRTKAAEYKAIARLPRDEGRAQHGGARIACPKHPDAPLTRTRIWRCTEDDCTWVHQDTATVGVDRHKDGAGDVGDVSEIHGSPFVTTVQGVDGDVRHQDGPVKYGDTHRHQDGAGSRPISFVSAADQEWADTPNYWGDAAPDPPPAPPAWDPPPLAPSHHIARAFRRLPPPSRAVAGGEQ